MTAGGVRGDKNQHKLVLGDTS